MFLLELPTLFLAAALCTVLLAGLLLVTWWQAPTHRALAWWGGSYLILIVAIPLLAIRGLVPPFFPYGLANGLFIAAGACAWIAARRFEGRSYQGWWAVAPLIVWLALYSIPAIGANPPIRMAAVSIGLGGFLLAGAYEFWLGRKEQLISRWPAIVTMAALGLMLFVRVPYLILVEFGSGRPASLEGSLTIVALLGFVYIVLMACNILAMTKERSELTYRHQARTDALTRLLNRGAFLDEAEVVVQRARLTRQPVSLILFDLDRFKQVNDRFGHLLGDLVLRTFAQTATAEPDTQAIIGRVGGEEFAMLLPELGSGEAAMVAERLRQAFQTAGQFVDGRLVEATLSAGVATTDGESKLLTLLADADRALYAAKESGRNTVRIAQVEVRESGAEKSRSAAA